MSNKEKEIKKPAEELSEDYLGNVSGGYTISGKGDVWVVNGITPENRMFTSTATSYEEASDIAKEKQLKTGISNGLKGFELTHSTTAPDDYSIYNW